MRCLSVDPGLGGTGWARWSRLGKLQACGTLRNPPSYIGDAWEARAIFLAQELDTLVDWKPHGEPSMVVEFPEHFGAGRDLAWKTGDLQRTVFLIGAAAGLLAARGHRTLLVLVRTWKGQLPKSVTNERIVTRLTPALIARHLANQPSHTWDAVGIGLWAHGKF